MDVCNRDALFLIMFVSWMFGAVIGVAGVWLRRWMNPPRPPAGTLPEWVSREIRHAASTCRDLLTAHNLRRIADALDRRAA
jgi:hypothetical protein